MKRPIGRWAWVWLLGPALLAGSCGPRREPGAAARSARVEAPESAAQENVDRLRSLPYAGFAAQPGGSEDGVVTYDEKRSAPGYNLYSIHEKCRAELVDARGRLVRAWEMPSSSSWSNAELLPGGDLVVVGWDANERSEGIGDDKRYLARFDWNGRLLWKRMMPAHHDVELTPKGELLTLTFRRRVIPEVDPAIPVRDDQLTVLDQSGRELRSLSFYDMFRRAPAIFPLAPVAPNTAGGAPWIDMFHGNAIETMNVPALAKKNPLYALSNILVCFRHQDRVAILDGRRGEVLWSWGLGVISGPHDAHMLDDGHVLLFDNGISRGWSRAVEMDPLTGAIVWEYKAPRPQDFFSVSRGSVQRLPNGNTLITDSDHGATFEVTPGGETVWRFLCRERNAKGQRATIVRMKRYPVEFVEPLMKAGSGHGQRPQP